MISIVTGTLNRIDHLKRVIENTVDSDPRLELVLIDGGSTDGTIEFKSSKNKTDRGRRKELLLGLYEQRD